MKKSRRRSASEGAAMIARYETSGLTQREFADRNDMTMSALQYWLRKARAEDDGGESEQFRFVEVIGDGTDVRAPMCGVSIEVGGLTLRFENLPSPSYLASVATALAEE